MVRCVEISTSTPLASLSATYTGSPVVLSIAQRSSTHYLLSIRPPILEQCSSPYRSETLLHSHLPNGDTIVVAGPTIDGVPYADVIADPPSLNLGFVEYGSVAREAIVVRISPDSGYDISDYSIDAPAAALTLERIDDRTHKISLQWPATAGGTPHAQITITLTAPGKPNHQLVVPVQYYGVRRAG